MTRRKAARSPRALAATAGFRDFVLDQLDGLDVTARSMFGGVGLYARGRFFGLLARNDALYLKVDEVNRPDYEAIGAKPFRPYPDRPSTMRYYPVPVSVLESAPDLIVWAKKAIAAAERAALEPRRARSRRGTADERARQRS